jgi:branched-chain amino acid transport system substrate-binding protein
MIGLITAGPYSAAHDSPLNKTYVADFQKVAGERPDFASLGAYDGLHAVYEALKKTGGDTDGDKMIAAIRGMAWESPRGPISIDADTRDIVSNIYMRKVEKINGELWAKEFETFPNVKDPMKVAAK